jgi:peptide/nickel transport system permease protein
VRRLVLRRLVWACLALWLVASLAFALIHLAPGGPAVALGGEHGAPGYLEEMQRVHGLDRPLGVQYLDHLRRLASGDLGLSYRSQRPVVAMVGETLPLSLTLILSAILLSAVLGTLLGLVAAGLSPGAATLFNGAMAALHAVPSYVVGQALVVAFALWLGWLPVQGLADPRLPAAGPGQVLTWARHLVLPVMALTIHQMTFMALLTRARIAEEMALPYAVTARAKGLGVLDVRRRHALPNAMLAVATLSGTRVAGLMGGLVVIETLFALPGLGRLVVNATIARDHPVAIGAVVVAAAIVIFANLITDILVAVLDPRTADEPAP